MEWVVEGAGGLLEMLGRHSPQAEIQHAAGAGGTVWAAYLGLMHQEKHLGLALGQWWCVPDRLPTPTAVPPKAVWKSKVGVLKLVQRGNRARIAGLQASQLEEPSGRDRSLPLGERVLQHLVQLGELAKSLSDKDNVVEPR